jgi:hypothetical protein
VFCDPDPDACEHLMKQAWSTAAKQDSLQAFRDWQTAIAALRAAEGRRDPHIDTLRLSTDVIRTRNALTLDQVQAGWDPPDAILRHLSTDQQLLLAHDDSAP